MKNIPILLIDLCMVYLSLLLASLLIYDFRVSYELLTIIKSLYWVLPVYALSFLFLQLYKSIFQYAGIEEAFNVLFGVLAGFSVTAFVKLAFSVNIGMNTLILANIILFCLLTAIRFSFRIFMLVYNRRSLRDDSVRTLIIGAGAAANILIKELREAKESHNRVICLADDDLNKVGRTIQGIRVAGTTDDLFYLVNKHEIAEIIVCIPSATKSQLAAILHKCEFVRCKVKVMPPVLGEGFGYKRIRDVDINDLLGRDEVIIDKEGIKEYIENETVLVTGGGGSIGSEICRQLSLYHPKLIIIFDIYENNAYDIQNELLSEQKAEVRVLIGSVQDKERLEEVFNTYHPTIVFHAAAHKHVPLMEDSPKEAVKNNVFGTYNAASLSHQYHVKKFILISTDKAVNPTNIMGATKRLAEMIISAFNKESTTKFASVRFGNVLNSNGSVIPLFKKQIERGGPVTVTHKDVYRYFMTISEAVTLVLEAGKVLKGGEVFVLDMGKPVRIYDLAVNLIRLSGFQPYKDIEIKMTGLRPGEKLYEELLTAEENLEKTLNKKIFVMKQKAESLNVIDCYLGELKPLLSMNNVNIRSLFHKYIPTYKEAVT